MSIGQRVSQSITGPAFPHRIMATVIISAIAGGSVHAEERNGWKLEWTGATSGNYSEELDCVSTLPSGSCSAFSGEIGITGQNSGSLILDEGGVVLSGSSEGYSSQFLQTRQTGECYPAEAVIVPNEYKFLSENSLDLWGPSIGEQITIYERASESGSNEVYFNASYDGVCYSFAKESGSGTDSSCEPYDYTTVVADETSDPCPAGAWGTAGWATGTGSPTDERNLVFSGTTSQVAGYLPAGLLVNVSQVPYTNTLSMTATKIPLPEIHGIELTQAIQIYQELDDLSGDLANAGSPPIPLVAYKPLAVRVALDQPVVTVKAVIEVFWNGTSLGRESLTQRATCQPPDMTGVNKEDPDSRKNSPNCKTADFIIGGLDENRPGPVVDEGNNRLLVELYSDDPDIGVVLLDEHEFVVDAFESDTIVLGAVTVCATRTEDGRWGCTRSPVPALQDGAILAGKVFPTDKVEVFPTRHKILLELVDDEDLVGEDDDQWDCYDTNEVLVWDGTEQFEDELPSVRNVKLERLSAKPLLMCEKEMWWYVVAYRINELYELNRWFLDSTGLQWYFYGLVEPSSLTKGTLGQASDIPGRGAVGVTTGSDGEDIIDSDLVRDTVAHEVGHLLDRVHVPTENDEGEYDWDSCGEFESPKWPPELYLFSDHVDGIKQEVAFDVTGEGAIQPFVRHDIMSYCDEERTWASPETYLQIFRHMHPPGDEVSEPDLASISDIKSGYYAAEPASGAAGDFWLVSGMVGDGFTFLEPVFAFETIGPTGLGTGSHQLEVVNNAGATLFTRSFTPVASNSLYRDPVVKPNGLPLSFAQLIPVQVGAERIIIRGAGGTVLSEAALGGTQPQVTLAFPVGGEQIAGEQTLAWSASDDDTDPDDLVYWVQYSADSGNNWMTLAQRLQGLSLNVDFDALPGAAGTAMIRVLATDSANTGTATSGMFTVGKKLPEVNIVSPEIGHIAQVGEPVFFEGYGNDLDDGVLPSNTHSWSSDRDGDIGVGHKVSTSALSEGRHNIRLSVTDSDSNMAFGDVTVLIGQFPDADGDGVADGQDQCPGTPAGEVADANGCSASQLDSDGDGVSDADDQCPGTPAGEAADASGCSASQIDSDGDGVSNADDLCPNTPLGEPRDANGCSNSQLDSDGDGVSDADDRCGGTPAGTPVDNRGCATSTGGGGGSSGGGGGSFGFITLVALGLAIFRRGANVAKQPDIWPGQERD